MPRNFHTTGSRVSNFSPAPSRGAGVGRMIFTNKANSTLDNKYVVGSGVSSSMLGAGIRGALKRRANNTASGKPCCLSNVNNINIIQTFIATDGNINDAIFFVRNNTDVNDPVLVTFANTQNPITTH